MRHVTKRSGAAGGVNRRFALQGQDQAEQRRDQPGQEQKQEPEVGELTGQKVYGFICMSNSIGNVRITPQGGENTQRSPMIACEDTRVTGKLMSIWYFSKLVSYHELKFKD